VLYDETFDVTFRLNHTALMIWNECDGATRLDQIAQRLAGAYGVSGATARADVNSVVPQMVEAGLIRTAPEATRP
jgi:hypothetical protein